VSEAAWIGSGVALAALWLPGAALLLRSLAKTLPLADFLALHEAQSSAAPSTSAAFAGSAAPVSPTTNAAPARVLAAEAPTATPGLSVVITACDEEEEIEAAVGSFLAQRALAYELVVVNDRSRDRTGEILDRLAATPAAAGRLVVVHNRDLPPGRLGKCHACALGAERARGAWILFADGDVRLGAPDLLARVLRAAERARLDHLAVLPDLRPQSALAEAVTTAFGGLFLLGVRAYESDRDAPRGGGGVGAFNLVRRAAYERIGGHRLLLMDVADDYKLGRLLKESGARQRMFFGRDLVLCRWQKGAAAVVRGLEKNFFGGCDYSLTKALGAAIVLAAVGFGPLVLLVAAWAAGVFPGPDRAAAAAALPAIVHALVAVTAYLAFGARTGARFGAVLLGPAGFAFVLAALANSTWRVLRRGGVVWRGTFYPLAELRRGLVPVGAGRKFRPAP
jgi:hypothetical protein